VARSAGRNEHQLRARWPSGKVAACKAAHAGSIPARAFRRAAQWRHSGLVNYMSRTATGLQVRVEGLWIA
jgi:hypothetical protein